MYLKDKENLVKGQSVNKLSFSCPRGTATRIALLFVRRFNFTTILGDLGINDRFLKQFNGFIAIKRLFWLSNSQK